MNFSNDKVNEVYFNQNYRYIDEFNYEIKLPMTASIIQFEEEIKTAEVEFVFDEGISISEIIIVGGEC